MDICSKESDSPTKRKKFHQNCGCCCAIVIDFIKHEDNSSEFPVRKKQCKGQMVDTPFKQKHWDCHHFLVLVDLWDVPSIQAISSRTSEWSPLRACHCLQSGVLSSSPPLSHSNIETVTQPNNDANGIISMTMEEQNKGNFHACERGVSMEGTLTVGKTVDSNKGIRNATFSRHGISRRVSPYPGFSVTFLWA